MKKQNGALVLAGRIERAIREISEKSAVASDVSFDYHYNAKGFVVGMDVTIKAAAEISKDIPEVKNWHPKVVETSLVPLLEGIAMAS